VLEKAITYVGKREIGVTELTNKPSTFYSGGGEVFEAEAHSDVNVYGVFGIDLADYLPRRRCKFVLGRDRSRQRHNPNPLASPELGFVCAMESGWRARREMFCTRGLK
jgi:hypothetical protein